MSGDSPDPLDPGDVVETRDPSITIRYPFDYNFTGQTYPNTFVASGCCCPPTGGADLSGTPGVSAAAYFTTGGQASGTLTTNPADGNWSLGPFVKAGGTANLDPGTYFLVACNGNQGGGTRHVITIRIV
jgi:hypothetical protein